MSTPKDWVSSLEHALREGVQSYLRELLELEVTRALGRLRYGRQDGAQGHRNGHRAREGGPPHERADGNNLEDPQVGDPDGKPHRATRHHPREQQARVQSLTERVIRLEAQMDMLLVRAGAPATRRLRKQ